MNPRTHWFLVADAAHARVLARDDEERPMRILHRFEHLASRAKSAQLGDDRAGRELSGRGFGGAAFEPRVDEHRKEHLRFAHQLAVFMEQEAKADSFDSLDVFAPSPFLGVLKQALGPACVHRLSSTHDVNLSRVGAAEIGQRIDRLLDEAAGHPSA